MAYFDFLHKIDKEKVHIIFELGSRDLKDAVKLLQYFDNSDLYAFECNPDCLKVCHTTMNLLDRDTKKRLHLIDKAISETDGETSFLSFDLELYDNMGASSMLEIDFSNRHPTDPDYNRANPQKRITVDGIRLDTFIDTHREMFQNIDLLCMDLQGYELKALMSLGKHLTNVKYIITECAIRSTYKNGVSFEELRAYLECFGFHYVCSNMFGEHEPDPSNKYFSEFDALFENKRK